MKSTRILLAAIPLLTSILLLLAPSALSAQPSHPEPEKGDHDHGAHQDGQEPQHGTEYRHGTMEHDFSGAEEWSARFDSPERKAWQKPDEIVALLEIGPDMTLVDLGAGTGYFLGYLSAAAGEGGRVLALDVEPDMVRFMRERAEREDLGNVEPRRIPYDDPELAAASADRVLIVNTWHHIRDRAAYSKKLLAALKPGGRVYVVDFTRDSPSGPPVEERLDPEQVIDELSRGGLEATLVEETLPRQYVVVGKRSE